MDQAVLHPLLTTAFSANDTWFKIIKFVILDKVSPKSGLFFIPKMNKALLFLSEAKEELLKVIWPTREQTIRYTVLVVIVAVAVGLLLGGLDYVLTILTDYLITR